MAGRSHDAPGCEAPADAGRPVRTLCCSPAGAVNRGSPRQTQRDQEGSAAAANTNPFLLF